MIYKTILRPASLLNMVSWIAAVGSFVPFAVNGIISPAPSNATVIVTTPSPSRSWRVSEVGWHGGPNCTGVDLSNSTTGRNSSPARSGHALGGQHFWTRDLFNSDGLFFAFNVSLTDNVASISVSQVPGHTLALRATLSVPLFHRPPGVLIQTTHVGKAVDASSTADVGTAVIASSTSDAEGKACLSFRCHRRAGFHPSSSAIGTAIGTPSITNACQCAALCQTIPKCRSWSFFQESHAEHVSISHSHDQCKIFSNNWNASDLVERDGWVSGSAGIFVNQLNVSATAGARKTIELTGWNFPVVGKTQRIKIVLADESFDDALGLIGGLSCSGSLCHPGPTRHDSQSASWDVTFSSSVAQSKYALYYCPESCATASMWTRVPGFITVPGSSYSWDVFPQVMSSNAKTAVLSVHQPENVLGVAFWGVALIKAGQSCSDDGARALSPPALRHQIYQNCDLLIYSEKSIPGRGLTWNMDHLLHGEYFFESADPKEECSNRCKPFRRCVGFQIGEVSCVFFYGDMDALGFGDYSYGLSQLASELETNAAHDSYILDCRSVQQSVHSGSVKFLLHDVAHGNYQVCVCDVSCGVDGCGRTSFDSMQNCPHVWQDIPRVEGTNWLEVFPTSHDEQYAPGPHPQQRWTLQRSFDDPKIKVYGHRMNTYSFSQLRFQTAVCGSISPGEVLLTSVFSDQHANHTEYFFGPKNEPDAGQIYHGCWCSGVANCNTNGAFNLLVGQVAFTARFDISNDYLFGVDEDNSIQVTGQNLNVTMDRIMVIDCKGTCGISSSTALHAEGPPIQGAVASDHWDSRRQKDCCDELNGVGSDVRYWKVESRTCVHGYLSAETGTGSSCVGQPEIDILISDHGLCVGESQCSHLCNKNSDCIAYSFNSQNSKCHMHSSDCFDFSSWSYDTSYSLHVKQLVVNDGVLGSGSDIASLSLLDFGPFRMPLGTFKICGCDYELLQDGQTCTRGSPDDYVVELGLRNVSLVFHGFHKVTLLIRNLLHLNN